MIKQKKRPPVDLTFCIIFFGQGNFILSGKSQSILKSDVCDNHGANLLVFKQSNMVEKFAQKKPTCIAYDEKLQFYSNLVIEVRK